MRRLSTDLPFSCVTCEVEIRGPAVFHVGMPFCCAGCVAGGPCLCTYDFVVTDDERSAADAVAEPTVREPVRTAAELAPVGR
jgi:hypothetical protein